MAATPRQASPEYDVRRGDTLAVRPYALTRGRTRAMNGLTIESLVAATPEGLRRLEALPAEYRRLIRLATIPVSIAEAAAHTGTMVGVTKVLVGDLVVNRLMTVRNGVPTLAPTREILEAVLRGLTAL